MTDLIVLEVNQELSIKSEFAKGGEGLKSFSEVIDKLAREELQDIEAVENAGDVEEGLKMRRRLGTKIKKSIDRVDDLGKEAYQEALKVPDVISKARREFVDSLDGENGIRTVVLEPVRRIEARRKELTSAVNLETKRINGIVERAKGMSLEEINASILDIDSVNLEFFDDAQSVAFDGARYTAVKQLNEIKDVKISEIEAAKKAEEERKKKIEEEAKRKAEEEAAENEKRIIAEREAAKKAQEEAQKEAERLKIEAEEREKRNAEALEKQKEAAERARIEAEKRAAEALEAEKKRAEQRIKEAERLAEEKAKKEKEKAEAEAEARKADKANQATKNSEALKDFVAQGFSEEDAKKIVVAIATNKIRNTRIIY